MRHDVEAGGDISSQMMGNILDALFAVQPEEPKPDRTAMPTSRAYGSF
jgi:hypothetical protein